MYFSPTTAQGVPSGMSPTIAGGLETLFATVFNPSSSERLPLVSTTSATIICKIQKSRPFKRDIDKCLAYFSNSVWECPLICFEHDTYDPSNTYVPILSE